MKFEKLMSILGGVVFAMITSFYSVDHSFNNFILGTMTIALCECCVLSFDDFLLRKNLKLFNQNNESIKKDLNSVKKELELAKKNPELNQITKVVHQHNETYNVVNNSFIITNANDDINGKSE